MVARVVEQGRSITEAASAAGASERTCSKWVGRFRAEGERGVAGSLLGAEACANRTDEARSQLLAALRRLRFTAPELADLLGCRSRRSAAILKRIGMGKLGRLGLEPADATSASGRAS